MNIFWLNIYGKLIFQNKDDKYLFAERTSRHIDKIVLLDESHGYRNYVGECRFSEFKLSNWIPISKEEYKMIKTRYTEIIVIREVFKLNKQLKKIPFLVS